MTKEVACGFAGALVVRAVRAKPVRFEVDATGVPNYDVG